MARSLILGIAMLSGVRATLVPSSAATAAMFLLGACGGGGGGGGRTGMSFASANQHVLDALDRPQAAEKINVHGWGYGDSSDDSSDDDDDDGDDDDCLKRNKDGSCQVRSNVQHFKNDFGQIEIKWSSCNDPYDDGNHEDFEEVAIESSLYQRIIFEENLKAADKCLRLDNTLQQVREGGRDELTRITLFTPFALFSRLYTHPDHDAIYILYISARRTVPTTTSRSCTRARRT